MPSTKPPNPMPSTRPAAASGRARLRSVMTRPFESSIGALDAAQDRAHDQEGDHEWQHDAPDMQPERAVPEYQVPRRACSRAVWTGHDHVQPEQQAIDQVRLAAGSRLVAAAR